MKKTGIILCLLLMFAVYLPMLLAQEIIKDVNKEKEKGKRSLLVPYAFYTDSLELAGGVAGGLAGHFQEQSTIFGALMITSNESYAAGLIINDIQMPVVHRLFGGLWLFGGKFTKYEEYIDGNPLFPDERAGSNDSNKDDFLESVGETYYVRIPFSYVLPIGDGADPIATYMLDRGILVSGATGGTSWNPLKSGRSYVEITPFYRDVKLEVDIGDVELKTSGVDFGFRHDNRDFPSNPTKGSLERITFSRDFGAFDSDTTYTSIEAELRKYFSFGETKWARQRVLALNVWYATCPTWEDTTGVYAETMHAPPYFMNPTLGGFFRMRGYPSNRFYGKSAIYYGAEYRYMPHWNPFTYLPVKHFNQMDWWQVVGFVELGRVSDEDNSDLFFKDLKWDAGIGLRLMISQAVFRLDFGFSDEGMGVWCMVGHPF